LGHDIAQTDAILNNAFANPTLKDKLGKSMIMPKDLEVKIIDLGSWDWTFRVCRSFFIKATA